MNFSSSGKEWRAKGHILRSGVFSALGLKHSSSIQGPRGHISGTILIKPASLECIIYMIHQHLDLWTPHQSNFRAHFRTRGNWKTEAPHIDNLTTLQVIYCVCMSTSIHPRQLDNAASHEILLSRCWRQQCQCTQGGSPPPSDPLMRTCSVQWCSPMTRPATDTTKRCRSLATGGTGAGPHGSGDDARSGSLAVVAPHAWRLWRGSDRRWPGLLAVGDERAGLPKCFRWLQGKRLMGQSLEPCEGKIRYNTKQQLSHALCLIFSDMYIAVSIRTFTSRDAFCQYLVDAALPLRYMIFVRIARYRNRNATSYLLCTCQTERTVRGVPQ